MRAAKPRIPAKEKHVDVQRHSQSCSVCSHPAREEIERDFVAWKSASSIMADYGIDDRRKIYRHANAHGLYTKRQRNVRAALEKIIEKAGDVEVNAAAVVSAIQAYAKINAQGHWVERSEILNLNDLFDRMSAEELEAYTREGSLPDWFNETVGATRHAEEGIGNSQPTEN